MTGLLGSQNVIHIEDVVTVLIVEPVILHALAWFGENAARISRRLVLKAGITYAVGRWKMACKSLKRLESDS
jgi:hypothetical protein